MKEDKKRDVKKALRGIMELLKINMGLIKASSNEWYHFGNITDIDIFIR